MPSLRFSAFRISIFIALLCCAAVLIATANYGIGYTNDSFSYVYGAEALRTDGILTTSTHIVHYPPFLSALLILLNSDPQNILWLNLLILFCNVCAFGYLLSLFQVRWWITASVLIAVSIAPEIITRHASLMSEPLFLLLMQLAFVFTLKKQLGWAALCAALAPMQRHVGLTVIAACAVYILLKYGWKHTFGFGMASSIPFVLWTLRNYAVVGNSGRDFSVHLISFSHIKNGLYTLGVSFWLMPMFFILVALFYVNRHKIPLKRYVENIPDVVLLTGIFSFIYGSFLVISISFFDFLTPLNSRILSPVLPCSWLILAWIIDKHFKVLNLFQQRILTAIWGIIILSYIAWGGITILEANHEGIGLAKNIEPTFYDEVAAALSSGGQFYTNDIGTMILMRLTDERLQRGIRGVPLKYNEFNQQVNEDYEENLTMFEADLESGRWILVWFEELQRDSMPTLEELKALGIAYKEYDNLVLFRIDL